MGKTDSEYSPKGCASHRLCYCCHSAGSETPSSASSQDYSPNPPTNKSQKVDTSVNCQGDGPEKKCDGEVTSAKDNVEGVPLKSNLKKKCGSSFMSLKDAAERYPSPNSRKSPARDSCREDCETGEENGNLKRKVQWTDAHGKELTQIKEFDRSESNWSDDECIGEANESCKCVIQ